MAKRRRIVGWQERETAEMAVFRHAANAMSVDDILAEARVVRLPYYWCAADRPDGIRLAAVYDRTAVPEDAECATCYIRIRELQEMMGARG